MPKYQKAHVNKFMKDVGKRSRKDYEHAMQRSTNYYQNKRKKKR